MVKQNTVSLANYADDADFMGDPLPEVHRTQYTPRIDTEKRSVIRENNLPIPKSIIREIRVIRLIRDSEKNNPYNLPNPRFRKGANKHKDTPK